MQPSQRAKQKVAKDRVAPYDFGLPHTHKAFRQEMFDVCFAMFDVSMRR